MTTTAAQDLAGVDLSDLSLWADGPPHALFTRMRREHPVHWSPLAGFPWEAGFWSITRYEDVIAMSKDWETFSSARGGTSLMDLTPQQLEPVARDALYPPLEVGQIDVGQARCRRHSRHSVHLTRSGAASTST